MHGNLLGVYFVVFIDTKRILQKLSGCKQKLKEGHQICGDFRMILRICFDFFPRLLISL